VFQTERCRLQAEGNRIDDDTLCTLLVIQDDDGSWAVHGLGAPGVRLTHKAMIGLAERIILGRAG
jgi:hypothetical protein